MKNKDQIASENSSFLEALSEVLWKIPDSYYGATWEGYFVLCGRHRDSDALSRSNFDCFERIMGDSVQIVRESHWAVGWVEWLALSPNASEADRLKAGEVICALADYPVVDDEHFSETEQGDADEMWKNCFDLKGRKEWLLKNWDSCELESLKGCFGAIRDALSGKYFTGYSGEFLY